jgi:hypothetical protein
MATKCFAHGLAPLHRGKASTVKMLIRKAALTIIAAAQTGKHLYNPAYFNAKTNDEHTA